MSSLLVAGSPLTRVGHAEDGKVYPAIACQPALVGNPSTLAYQGDKITNSSNAYSVVVACPVDKDDVFSTAGTNEGYVRFRKFSDAGFLGDLHAFQRVRHRSSRAVQE